MTTSMTRSRRAEGLLLPNPKVSNNHRLIANPKADQFNAPRAKRKLDASARDFDPVVAKRPRFTTGIAVEIPSRPSSFHSRFPQQSPAVVADLAPSEAPPTKPAIARPNATSRAAATAAPPARAAATTASAQQLQKQQQQQPQPTKHQEKVANGLKHELNRLQPNVADTKDQGRKLRSQEASRFRSELSSYFPDYDEVIGNDPKEQHLLNIETPILITLSEPHTAPSSSLQPHPSTQHPDPYPIRSYGDALFTDLFDSQIIDFSFLNTNTTTSTSTSTSTSSTSPPSTDDPLPDTLFLPAHKKAERLERSIRNSEKGRAQHERDQIIRLLDGLQGPDWLRVMGVSGVTESRKKTFEPAREHFIAGCEGILDKFRRWAREEKRRKVEKAEKVEAAGAKGGKGKEAGKKGRGRGRGRGRGGKGEEVTDEDGVEEVADSEAEEVKGEEVSEEEQDEGEEEEEEDEDEEGDDVEGEPPDDSDVDASVAKQLREEALAAAAAKKKKTTATGISRRGIAAGRGKVKTQAAQPPSKKRPKTKPQLETPALVPEKEFTSFFAKRYQREAALSKSRRRGRTVLAWGHPIPEMPEAEFALPGEIKGDEATLRTRERKRRRDKRGKGQ